MRIRREAWKVLNKLWASRSKLLNSPATKEQLLPIDPRLIATGVLDLQYDEPESLLPETMGEGLQSLTVQTAGLLDRKNRRIAVAQSFKPEWRRFTGSHELGHWVLHPGEILHRDRPLSGLERANSTGRAIVEQEADLFGAELLMPSGLLTKLFKDHYGAPLDGTKVDWQLANFLSIGTGRAVDPLELASKGRRYRSLLIAQNCFFGNHHFASLAHRFGVNPTPLAIQLEDLGLVI